MKTTRNTSSGRLTIIAPSGIVLFIMILFSILGGQKSFGQGVGISETSITADPSSILELKWTSGPFKGFLAPRMTYANMLAIPSPAQGLLVFATDKKSFWYFDGTWKAVAATGLGAANQLLGMDNSGNLNEYKTLNGSSNILVTHTPGNINLTTSQDIHPAATPTFAGLKVSSLAINSGVYTDGFSFLTTSPPSIGTLGYWSRAMNILTPANPGDWVTTSGNIYTTGTGFITSAGLLTGLAGITVTGGAVNLNNSSNFATNINTGTSSGNVTIGNLLSSLYLPKFSTAGILHNNAAGLISSSLLSLTTDISGILPVLNGGTGLPTFGGINTVLYTSAADVLTSVATSTAAGQFLQTTTSGGAPTWETILDVSNGGTGLSNITTNNLIYGNGTGPVTLLAPGAITGSILTTTATGAPGWLTLNTLPTTSGILQAVNGGTGYDNTYSNGQLLIGNSTGTLTRNPLTGTANQIYVTNGNGSITLSAPQDIHTGAEPTFLGLTLSGLNPSAGVYTDASRKLTSAPPTSGTIGYWDRTGTILSPTNSGDAVTTSGNIYTTAGGFITSSGLLTGNLGATISGAAINLNDNSNFGTNINTGTSSGNVTIGNLLSSLYLPKFTTPGLLHNDATGLVTSSQVSLTGDVINLLPVGSGGTGLNNITTNNLIYGNGTNPVSLLAPGGTTGAILTTTATGAPGWLTLNTLPATSGILQTVNGGTGQSIYTNGQLLIGNTAGSLTRTTLTGTANQINVTNGDGSITLWTPQDIHNGASPTFVGLTLSGLLPNRGVYTNGTSGLTSTPPNSGTIGFWDRNNTTFTLSPTTAGDAVTTSGNIYTTGTGTITSAGLLTGLAGITVTGGAVNLNDNSNNVTNINTGTSTGAVTIGGSGTQTISVGDGAGVKTVSLGSNNTTSTTTILSGTGGALSLNAAAGGAVTNIGTGATTGNINIGGLNSIYLPGFTTAGILHNDDLTGLVTSSKISLTADVINLLPVGSGGTGLNNITTNNLIYGNGTNPVSLLAPGGTTGAILTTTATGAPGWLTLNTLPTTSGILQAVNGGTGYDNTYSNGQLLIGNASGTLTRNTLTGTANQIYVTNGDGSITLSTPQDIHSGAAPTFLGLTLSGLTANSGVYTDGSKALTSTPPLTGNLGYWNRTGTVLSPTTAGDAVTTSGNIYTSGTGTITSAGLLTGNLGLTVTGGAVNLNNSSNNPTNINTGTSSGNVTIGNSLSSLYLPKFTTLGILHNDIAGLISSSLLSLTTDISGILPVLNGGTGLPTFGGINTVLYTSAADVLTSVATSTAAGQFLQTTTAGSAPTWKTILDVANGGTGSSTQNFVDLTTDQTIGGVKTFTDAISASNLSGTNTGDITLTGENYLSLAGQVLTANPIDLSGTNATGTLAAGRFPALTGDVTTVAGALATTISPNSVTYAKMQNLSATSRLLGSSSTTLPVQEITLGSGLAMTGSTLTASGLGGTVTNFSSGNLSPLFTTSVLNPTTTPALSFSFSNAGPYSVFGNNTGVNAAPSYFNPILASALFQNQGTTNTVLHGSAAGNPSWSQVANGDIEDGTIDLTAKVTGVLPIVNGGTNSGTALVNNRIMISRGDKIVELFGLNDGQIIVGKNLNEPQVVTMSGDVSINNSGAATVGTVGGSTAADINTAEILANASTDLSTASTIVRRDASGNFIAGTISADLTGNVTGNVSGSSGSTTGNAATATALQTARTINGTSFDGTTNITVTAAAGTLTGTTLNPTVVTSSLTSVGTLANLTVTNPIAGSVTGTAANVTGIVAIANGGTGSATQNFVDLTTVQTIGGAKTFTGAITASNLSGTNTGDQTNITGNAATATKLSPGNTINGVNFDGSAPITVTAAAGTLTGTTLNPTVVTSSLTSVGTLANLTVTNPIAGSVTGTSANVTGIVAIANGGTGSSIQNFVDLTTAQTIGGAKTFTGAISASNLSGTNTGDNAINALYSGLVTNATHTGEVTGSGALTITNGAVTYAKIQNIPALSVFGQSTNAAGVGTAISATATSNSILRESGSTIGFGSINLASSGAVGASILPIANGGTGSATQNFVDLTTAQTIGGVKTFSLLPTFSSLTLGSIPFAGVSGALTQDNANLFWDNTNKRLGIGTAVPSDPLNVVGDIKLGNATTGTIKSNLELVLRQDGDFYGPSILTLRNRAGQNGAIFETTDGTFTLVDFIFKTASNQRNIRYESRGNARTGSPSFHIGGANAGVADPDNPTLSIGDNYSAFNKPLRIGNYLAPTAWLHLAAGTATANTAPLKFTSGPLLTAAEPGAVEFLTDKYYGTITSGSARRTFAFLESPIFTTPNIGAATGTSLTVTGAISSTGTPGIGYATGAGGTITQITNKGTPVTINKICGVITTDNANLNSWTTASFTVNNSTVSATDVPVVAFSGGSTRSYVVTVTAVTNGSFEITILNATGGNRSEVLVINYAIIKAVIN